MGEGLHGVFPSGTVGVERPKLDPGRRTPVTLPYLCRGGTRRPLDRGSVCDHGTGRRMDYGD